MLLKMYYHELLFAVGFDNPTHIQEAWIMFSQINIHSIIKG